jgi:hypothetical protein
MIPRVLTLMPGVMASMAKARMAPSTIRKMPTPMLIFHVLQGADGDACLLVGFVPRCKTPNRSYALRTNLSCFAGRACCCVMAWGSMTELW